MRQPEASCQASPSGSTATARPRAHAAPAAPVWRALGGGGQHVEITGTGHHDPSSRASRRRRVRLCRAHEARERRVDPVEQAQQRRLRGGEHGDGQAWSALVSARRLASAHARLHGWRPAAPSRGSTGDEDMGERPPRGAEDAPDSRGEACIIT
jgi:hypothetical protein